MAKRKKSGARPEMKLGKRFSSCRGKRKTLITCFGSLPALGSETGGTHYRPTGGGCVMHDGGGRRWPMTMIPGAKQSHDQVGCLGKRNQRMA
jgi:hypothetical protein